MRLGGQIFEKYDSPEQWGQAVQRAGYRAVICPVEPDAGDDEVRAYADVAAEADILIAEVGTWSNPLSGDDAKRNAALQKCRDGLALADRIGSRCCVNIAGSRGEKWDGPHRADLTEESFEMIVETVRRIIDEVQPTRTHFTLEPMPWMFPDSADSYLRLLEAVDRDSFAVHFDPVNLVSSPQRYFDNGGMIREFIGKLGPRIRSCHAKDTLLADSLTVHIDEVPPGQGQLDYRTFLREVNKLDPEMPLIMEHMKPEQYPPAAEYIRKVAAEVDVPL